MKCLSYAKTRLVLIVFVATIVLGGENAYADLIISTPIETEPPIWSPDNDPQS